MTQKRAIDDLSYSPVPSPKRTKSALANWRSWTSSNNTEIPIPAREAPDDWTPSTEHSKTPSASQEKLAARSPRHTYWDHIRAAQLEHPDGLDADEMVEWFAKYRPEVYQKRGKEGLKSSILSTCSLHANKKKPDIWKYQDKENARRRIWKLSNEELEAGQVLTSQSTHHASSGEPPIDNIVLSNKEARLEVALWDRYQPLEAQPVQRTLTSSDMLTNTLVVSIEQAKSNSSSRETATTKSPPSFSGGQADMVAGMERSAMDNGDPEESNAQQPARAMQTCANDGNELIGILPDALRNAHATTGNLERDAAQRDEIYLGKLVVKMRQLKSKLEVSQQEIKGNRNTLPEIEALVLRANKTSEQAQKLEQQAEAARDHEDRIAVREYELRQAEQQLQKLRSELAID
ncbi:hypothetical protein LTR91_022627 [Friedmanniomyces endolithicus]|uniref:Uncharacterized protein n=1 Tax=Friedmanniomyces endolithicus TaxID=329885 RepID=A0AAN6H4G6_9PEZI|nr:hypothetical protein LTS01_023285 [Friedmanniomyces endolithicus]KAK0955906.1 hypothetical protein LTR91_022627 [Friedmanniomyces endolithicus]KAK1021036.1 hypothetical protein LTS16_026768 [Friedmanniomyces endolithicus]